MQLYVFTMLNANEEIFFSVGLDDIFTPKFDFLKWDYFT